MPYVSHDFRASIGKTIGDGECVAFVRETSGAPSSKMWKRGRLVRDAIGLSEGTAIATFDANGQYAAVRGRKHAAIYVGRDNIAITAVDQWVGQVVHERAIKFDNPGNVSNDGDAFYVIE